MKDQVQKKGTAEKEKTEKGGRIYFIHFAA